MFKLSACGRWLSSWAPARELFEGRNPFASRSRGFSNIRDSPHTAYQDRGVGPLHEAWRHSAGPKCCTAKRLYISYRQSATASSSWSRHQSKQSMLLPEVFTAPRPSAQEFCVMMAWMDAKCYPSQTLVGPSAWPCLGLPHQLRSCFIPSLPPTPYPDAVTLPFLRQSNRTSQRLRFLLSAFCHGSSKPGACWCVLCVVLGMWGCSRAMPVSQCSHDMRRAGGDLRYRANYWHGSPLRSPSSAPTH